MPPLPDELNEDLLNCLQQLHAQSEQIVMTFEEPSVQQDALAELLNAAALDISAQVQRHFPATASLTPYEQSIHAVRVCLRHLKTSAYFSQKDLHILQELENNLIPEEEYQILQTNGTLSENKTATLIKNLWQDFVAARIQPPVDASNCFPQDGSFDLRLEATEVAASLPNHLMKADDVHMMPAYAMCGEPRLEEGKLRWVASYDHSCQPNALNIVPVNHGNHWTTVLIDLRAQPPQAWHIDSMQGHYQVPPLVSAAAAAGAIVEQSVALGIQCDGVTCGYWIAEVANFCYTYESLFIEKMKTDWAVCYNNIFAAMRQRWQVLEARFPGVEKVNPEGTIQSICRQKNLSYSNSAQTTSIGTVVRHAAPSVANSSHVPPPVGSAAQFFLTQADSEHALLLGDSLANAKIATYRFCSVNNTEAMRQAIAQYHEKNLQCPLSQEQQAYLLSKAKIAGATWKHLWQCRKYNALIENLQAGNYAGLCQAARINTGFASLFGLSASFTTGCQYFSKPDNPVAASTATQLNSNRC